jgi:hypothetical protein
MEYFDALEEIHSAVGRYVDSHEGSPPERIAVSATLYDWLLEIEKEEALLKQRPVKEPFALETEYGDIEFIIDEMLSPYEIIAE